MLTGGTGGIGYATVDGLARTSRCRKLYLTSRSAASSAAATEKISKATGHPAVLGRALNLANLSDVRRFAIEFAREEGRLDLLVLNAGLFGAAEGTLTVDGYEPSFQVSHLGHFLLFQLLHPLIATAAAPVLVSVSSYSHFDFLRGGWGTEADWAALKQPQRYSYLRGQVGFREYGVAKLAQLLFHGEVLRRAKSGTSDLSQLTARAVHPGMVATDMYRRNIPWPFNGLATAQMLSPEEGARTTLFAALAPVSATENCPHAYFDGCRCKAPSTEATDPALQRRMWRASARAIAAFSSPVLTAREEGVASLSVRAQPGATAPDTDAVARASPASLHTDHALERLELSLNSAMSNAGVRTEGRSRVGSSDVVSRVSRLGTSAVPRAP